MTGVADGHVDYDGRERDARIETDLRFAASCLEGLVSELGALDVADNLGLDVSMNCGAGACPARSSIVRELQFLVSHTVHHYALIALILRVEGVVMPASFGVSPSTLEFQARPVKHAV